MRDRMDLRLGTRAPFLAPRWAALCSASACAWVWPRSTVRVSPQVGHFTCNGPPQRLQSTAVTTAARQVYPTVAHRFAGSQCTYGCGIGRAVGCWIACLLPAAIPKPLDSAAVHFGLRQTIRELMSAIQTTNEGSMPRAAAMELPSVQVPRDLRNAV